MVEPGILRPCRAGLPNPESPRRYPLDEIQSRYPLRSAESATPFAPSSFSSRHHPLLTTSTAPSCGGFADDCLDPIDHVLIPLGPPMGM